MYVVVKKSKFTKRQELKGLLSSLGLIKIISIVR